MDRQTDTTRGTYRVEAISAGREQQVSHVTIVRADSGAVAIRTAAVIQQMQRGRTERFTVARRLPLRALLLAQVSAVLIGILAGELAPRDAGSLADHAVCAKADGGRP